MIWWLCQLGYWGKDQEEACGRDGEALDEMGEPSMLILNPARHQTCGFFKVEPASLPEIALQAISQ